MQIVFVNQYYPPDVAPTGRVLLDYAEYLAGHGHDVKVICSKYAYEGGGIKGDAGGKVKVLRLSSLGFGLNTKSGRMLDYLSFHISLFFAVLFLRPRPDLIVSMTTPPYAGFTVRTASSYRRIKTGHWIMDVYPDVLVSGGMLKERSLTCRILRALARMQFKGCSFIMTIAPEMQKCLAQYAPPEKIFSVPLWSGIKNDNKTKDDAKVVRNERGWKENETVLMYSGNMGLAHRFDEFLESAKRLRENRDIRWVFAGGGRKRAQIEKFKAGNPDVNIEILPYVSSDKLDAHLASADVHLVSLDSVWTGTVLPSKIQDIMASGRPVILVGGKGSSLEEWIQRSGAGWVVKENSVDELCGIIMKFDKAGLFRQMRKNAQEFSGKNFNAQLNMEKMAKIIEA